MTAIRIGERWVGDGHPCMIVAEIGINHNGDIGIAKALIAEAAKAGCEAVKFQKRTVDLCYSEEELDRPRQSPWGTTNREQKEGLEFDADKYAQLDIACAEHGVMWWASCWDKPSVDFIDQFNPPAYKIASACLTDEELLQHTWEKGKPIILSTGMSTLDEIWRAVVDLEGADIPYMLLHCTSTYPARIDELNLACIPAFRRTWNVPIGYSGHEAGLHTTAAAVELGACLVERHITLDRSMYGSDQSASIEPHGFAKLVSIIRTNEKARGDGIKRVYDSELPIRDKLRKGIAWET